ncbi:MAG TPA: sel1 repeat family protein, partial [Epsilonproteobacteria bacterium]|nr:sel1 repeat family protein [Campylobacterota bacterium]
LNGKGVIQSYPKAKKFYGKACDNGHTKGCYNYKEI